MPTDTVAEQMQQRVYARDALLDSTEDVVQGCCDSLRLYGFCVIGTSFDPAIKRDSLDLLPQPSADE